MLCGTREQGFSGPMDLGAVEVVVRQGDTAVVVLLSRDIALGGDAKVGPGLDEYEGEDTADENQGGDRGGGRGATVSVDPGLELGHRAGSKRLDNASVEIGLKVFGEIEARAVAVFAAAGHGFFTDRQQLRGGAPRCLMDRFGRTLEDGREDGMRGNLGSGFHVRRMSGQEVVQDRAHGVDVRRLVDLLDFSLGLLHGHVRRGADYRSVHGDER